MNFVFLSVLLIFATTESSFARPTFGKNGLVVSASDLASQAGVSILKKGGSAADAAVATAFALAVTRPYYASLGGGGLMLTRFDNKVLALDYREHAPDAATQTMFLKAKAGASEIGGLAVGTPGNVRGLFELHQKFGKLSWSTDIAPALKLAKEGIVVTEELRRTTNEVLASFTTAGKQIFSKHGQPLQVGDLLKQPQLARAFMLLQKEGPSAFYKGAIAQDIVHATNQSGGVLKLKDLETYESRWVSPLSADVFGATVFTMPPPSSGGALILLELKLAEKFKLNDLKDYSANQFHLLAEIMSRAFFDRQYLADPKFMTIKPEQIYENSRVQKWASSIDPTKKTSFDTKTFELTPGLLPTKDEKGNTTHYCVVDREGNVVSSTTTLNGNYGSAVVTEKYGIVLNNEMDDFTTRPGEPNMFGLVQGNANTVGPGKTPVSSMTPTIVEKGGKFLFAVGAPGGPRITNAVFQTVFHSLTSDLNVDEIVQAPRVHHQYKPDTVYFDRNLSPDTQDALKAKGHWLKESTIARVYEIRMTAEGLLEGAFDNRFEGGAAGY